MSNKSSRRMFLVGLGGLTAIGTHFWDKTQNQSQPVSICPEPPEDDSMISGTMYVDQRVSYTTFDITLTLALRNNGGTPGNVRREIRASLFDRDTDRYVESRVLGTTDIEVPANEYVEEEITIDAPDTPGLWEFDLGEMMHLGSCDLINSLSVRVEVYKP